MFFKPSNLVFGAMEIVSSAGVLLLSQCRTNFISRFSALPILIHWKSAVLDLTFFRADLISFPLPFALISLLLAFSLFYTEQALLFNGGFLVLLFWWE